MLIKGEGGFVLNAEEKFIPEREGDPFGPQFPKVLIFGIEGKTKGEKRALGKSFDNVDSPGGGAGIVRLGL